MSKTKIVIIDDSNQMKKLASEYYPTHEEIELLEHVTDGANALECIQLRNPDVVVMDLILPNRDGLALLEEIKNLPVSPKVIITSAVAGDNFVHRAIELGASYYMVKPLSAEDLDTQIKRVSVDTRAVHSADQARIDAIFQNAASPTKAAVATPRNKNLEEKISNIFITVGIPAHIKGYQFLREAIKMAVESPEIVNSITKRLYPNIAERFNTSPSKVERAIRHAIEVAWNRGKIENINSVFGLPVYNANEKPTNGEFIALVADKMIIEGC